MMQTWKRLTTIQIGGALCLPVLAVGQQIALKTGFISAVFAIIIGNSLLCGLGLLIGIFGARHRLSTIECAEKFLGRGITYVVAATVVIACLGWFSLQLGIMVEPFSMQLGPLYTAVAVLVLGLLITVSSLKGVAAIGMLADYAAPLFMITLGGALFMYAGQIAEFTAPTFEIDALLIVVALALGAIVDLPTFFRFAKSERDAKISVIVLCMGALPAIEISGAYLGAFSQGSDIAHALIGSGGLIWYSWIVLFLILAGWTTNNANIYSANVSLRYLLPSLSEAISIGLLGTIGTIIALLIPCGTFCSIIELIALPVIPIGILIAYAAIREAIPMLPLLREYCAIALVVCALTMGIMHGIFSVTLTQYLLIDVLLAALGALVGSLLFIQARKIVL